MTQPGVAIVTRTSRGGQVMTVARYGYSAGHVSPSQGPRHQYIRCPRPSFTQGRTVKDAREKTTHNATPERRSEQ